ncbi:hypothetical protein P8625_13000 [Tenacibaculum tangerinum]|uniref:DUF4890 domain-containing protein n=1 Tax=Tenacibaculum tangerinum TaxID=3038772 RepID=A0ABY8L459_9FLAO|nr:hypothetical protein [Tenacibaculum tangerinum]WGH74983.1 hypothetical protein P8625_13000 [Tenacibaculum tangerinum]
MKNLEAIVITLMLFVTLGVHAQKKSEKKAKKITKEMTQVLDLTKNESEAIYNIQLNRFEQNAAIKKQYENQPEEKKQKLKELGNKVYNQLKNALGGKQKGKERLAKWKKYKQSKKK